MRFVLRLLAAAALAALAAMVLLGISAPWSPSGWFAIGAAAVGAIGLLIPERAARRGLLVVAGALVVALLAVRLVGGASGMIRMVTLPQGTSSRWLGRLVDEQDVALVGARILAKRWPLSADEREGLLPAMRHAYLDMRRDDVVAPSPVLDTLLGRQTVDAFDAVVIEPRVDMSPLPKYGVVFLHGYAGSFTLECWLVAKAAQTVGAVTVCPATSFSGHWRGEAGMRAVRASVEYLRGRGIQRVFLAGLSNGAIGASSLASSFAASLSGLILISGAPADGDSAGLPTLIAHGADDAITSATSARAFAERTHATYRSFPGGHFVLLMRREEVRKAIADWLMEKLGLHETWAPRR
jgi:pimeloyl-ACP methyl ester carboxylesterase